HSKGITLAYVDGATRTGIDLPQSLPSLLGKLGLGCYTISTQDLIVKEKMESQSETIQTVHALKLPMLRTRDYDLWSMRMVQYLTHTDYDLCSRGQTFFLTYADDVMLSFFANQSNSIQLDNEDLKQINTDDLEEMDLKCQLVMLTMRVKRFIKKTRRNLNFNGKETVGFDKTNVECYNCHRRGHFTRECREPRSQGTRNIDNTRRVVPVKNPTNALVVTDGMGHDWSYQAEEGPTDFALMAFSSLGSSSSDTEVNTCSKECLKSYQTFQKQYDQQRRILNKTNLERIAYQLSLESRIIVHRKNGAVFKEDIAFLKYDVKVRDISIIKLKNKLEESLQEKKMI
nr:hypothetical protein [Tanacetum cinerariifolium]